jgi:hypothetical protein
VEKIGAAAGPRKLAAAAISTWRQYILETRSSEYSELAERWTLNEDISLIDSKVKVFHRAKGMVVADHSTRSKGNQMGPRELMRRTKLSQKALYAVLNGGRVRQHTLDIFRRALAK